MMQRKSSNARVVDLERLERILDAYGADPEAWPNAERDDALALMASSPEARALRDRAARLDRLLDQAESLEPSPELRSRILAAAGAPVRSRLVRRRNWAVAVWPFGPAWQPAAALALAALIGMAVGTVAPLPSLVGSAGEDRLADEVAILAFGPEIDLEEQP